MFWQEDKPDNEEFVVPDTVMDLAFRIECPTLPVDHAHALRDALQGALPWLAEEPRAGIHSVHAASSGNGWQRPEGDEDGVLHLSRRTRLVLRLPAERVEAASDLEGRELTVDGHRLRVGKAETKPLVVLSTVFARYVLHEPGQGEEEQLRQLMGQLHGLGISPRKILCGRGHTLRTPDGPLHARSLMIADLQPPESVLLQQQGIGPGRQLGCGLFIGHKSVQPVKQELD